MKKHIIIYLLAFILGSTIIIGQTSDTFLKKDNYLSSAVISPYKIVKWQKQPIKIYIQNNKYKQTVKKAFNEWQNKTDNKVKFKEVPIKKDADISVSFVDNLKGLSNDKIASAGIAESRYMGNAIVESKINITTQDNKTKNQASKKSIYLYSLHEIGHAIGIVDHSPYKRDIMYRQNNPENKNGLSLKDIKTIKLIYSKDAEKLKISNKIPKHKIKEIETNIKNFPDNNIFLIKLGDLYKNYKNYPKAITYYKKALNMEPKNSKIYYLLGVCYNKTNKTNQAIEYYQKAIKTDKTNTKAYYGLALCFNKQNKTQKALEYTTIALSLEPTNYMYINSYAKLSIKLNRKEEAKKRINNIINNNPKLKENKIIQDSITILSKNKKQTNKTSHYKNITLRFSYA